MNRAITCPNCGATNGHKEDVPNRYICSYCDTVFEHFSYIGHKNINRVSHDYLRELLEKHRNLNRQNEYFLPDALAIIIQMPTLIEHIDDQDLIKKVINLITAEIKTMQSEGYNHHNEYDLKAEVLPYMEMYSLSQYHLSLSKIYTAKNYKNKDLKLAKKHCEIVGKLQEKYLTGIDRETKELHTKITKSLEA